jgi:histidinol-phosphate aminotransferase
MNWNNAIPSMLQELSPYQAGMTKNELKRKLGLKSVYKFASNESPLAPSDEIHNAVNESIQESHLYPDYFELKSMIANKSNLLLENVILGNGSIDVIELAFRLLAKDGKKILCSKFGYSAYSLLARACGLGVCFAESGEKFEHQVDKLISAIDHDTAILAIDNPTNMAGQTIGFNELKYLLSKVPGDVLVVLDQAYIEFIDSDVGIRSIELINEHSNLLITRTFSKAYGLAGFRIGYGLANAEIIRWLSCLQRPFPVASVAVKAALASLEDEAHVQNICKSVQRDKEYLTKVFHQCEIETLGGDGNFILISPDNELYPQLLNSGFIVRPMAAYGHPELLRISISSQEDIRLLGAKILQIYGQTIAEVSL